MNRKSKDERDWCTLYLMSAKSIAHGGIEEFHNAPGRRKAIRNAVVWIRRHKGGAVRLLAVGCGGKTLFSRGAIKHPRGRIFG